MSGVDRSAPPAAGELRPFRFPAFRRERLDNGLELILAPRREVPLLGALLQLPAGGERNPLERPGLAAMTASLVDEGTERRSGPELAAAVERLGGSLASRADWNNAEVKASLLARDLEAGLALVAEIARQPVFPEAELERLRARALAELLRRRDQPAVLAEEAVARTLYAGTPYGSLLLGDEASLEALAREEVLGFHAACWRPAGGALLLVGDFAPEAARAGIEDLFGDWTAAPPAAAPAVVPPAPPERRRVVVVDRPGAAQTEIRIAQVGVERTHPDRTLLGVLNALLGGKFTSRLNLNLRERHGYTYGASSRLVDRRSPGPLVIGAAVANEVAGAALREALGEIERLLREPVGEEELAETRSYLLGVFPYTLQTGGNWLSRLSELTLWGLPDDYFERALERVAEARPEDLLELARRHLRPDRAVLVAVGPAETLEPQLRNLGTVEVVGVPDSRT
ncbi:MAG TPA: pitrilysin family protein [Thermoanaerobaculia bacterium]|nr:pitrilysin family protein [Thermoanaerobaculia bacterium]